jgi:hypothetical protein
LRAAAGRALLRWLPGMIANDCPAVEWATVEVRELGPCFIGSE